MISAHSLEHKSVVGGMGQSHTLEEDSVLIRLHWCFQNPFDRTQPLADGLEEELGEELVDGEELADI